MKIVRQYYFSISLFFAVIVVQHFVYLDAHKSIARVLVNAIEPFDAMSDSRSVISSLRESNQTTFTCIEMKDQSNVLVFQIDPSTCEDRFKFANISVHSKSLNQFLFYYYNSSMILRIILSSFFFTAIVIGFGIFFNRKKERYEKHIALEKMRAEIMSGISKQVKHDVNSPLAAISTVAKNLPPELLKLKTLLIQSCKRIKEVISDLDSRVQIEGGSSFEFLLDLTALKPLMDAVILEKQAEHGEGRILTFLPQTDLKNTLVWTDKRHLHRALSNIINNSIESYDDPKLARVFVSIAVEGESVILSIADEGRGLSKNDLSFLGQKGFTKGKKNGKGLGLFHAFELAKAASSPLTIGKNDPAGTRVSITLKTHAP